MWGYFEWLLEKDVKESGCVLFKVLSQRLLEGIEENHEEHESGQLATEPVIEFGASGIQNSTAHSLVIGSAAYRELTRVYPKVSGQSR
jgi:hypothetical protein